MSHALRDHDPDSDEHHVLFVPTPGRYRLIERRGAAPVPGTTVSLSGGARFRVLRVGPSPLPGGRAACAYLEPLPE